MKSVKVTYIPVNSTEEKTIELVDIVRVSENLVNDSLNIEINDEAKANDSSILSEMVKGTIVAIILLDSEGKDEVKFTSYINANNITRNYYTANSTNGEIDKLRISFTKTISED